MPSFRWAPIQSGFCAAYAKETLLGESIEPISPPGHRQRTWEIAAEFGFPTVYDSAYLALAELRGCEFWTADQRLYKRVKNKLSFARWLGDYVTEGGVS